MLCLRLKGWRSLDWRFPFSLSVPTPAQVFTWNRSWGCFTQPWKEKQGQRLLAVRIGSPVSMPPLYLPPWYETPSPGHTMGGGGGGEGGWQQAVTATMNEKTVNDEWLNQLDVKELCAATVWVLGFHKVSLIHSFGWYNELDWAEKNELYMLTQVLS